MKSFNNLNYYVVPAANPQVTQTSHVNEDAYFSYNYSTTPGDPEMPFVTTYQTGGDLNSIWIFVPVQGESNYYYIVHAMTGKYMKYYQYLTGSNARRKFVHLETMDEPGETEKFEITARNTGVKIKPKNNAMYFNVAGDNQPRYNGGTTFPYYSGIIGGMDGTDNNSQFQLVDASAAADLTPVISVVDGLTNTFSITSPAMAFSTIHYTTDGTTTPDVNTGTATNSGSPIFITGSWTVQAVGVFGNFVTPLAGPKSLSIVHCPTPVITVRNSVATITSPIAGTFIYYTINGSQATTFSTLYDGSFLAEGVEVIRAIATSPGFLESHEAFYYPSVEVSSSSEITNMNGRYILREGFTSLAPIGTAENPFRGQIDGDYHAFTLNGHALVGVAEDAIIKNVVISSVTYSGSGNVGAIVNTAKCGTKIYNCGILGGSVSGGTNTGGLIGLIEAGSWVRVVNCYNFADVSGSSYAAGIVGKNEGTVASNGTVGNVRIALCMMYGNVTGATNISPVYCGNHVNNIMNFTEYNYWRYRSGLEYTVLNDQLPVEKDDYLTRFPFFRHILNSHRELAAFFLFGAASCNDMAEIADADIAEIGHWALKKDVAAYPIIEPWPTNTQTTQTSTNNNLPSTTEDYAGKLLTDMGTGGYLSVSVIIDGNTYSVSLPITDMDTLNYDFTWGKVVLPFANEFVVNTDYSRICTGWKITNVSPASQVPFENYNVSDRNCTTKDLYSTTGFIFAQGGNYIVPNGVTAIEITANFASAFYLCDEGYEIAYARDSDIAPPQSSRPSGYKTRTTLAGSTSTTYHGQHVYNTLAAALDAMNASGTTHAQAIVLIGNYHLDDFDLSLSGRLSKGYTIMSIDADNNQEPDYAIYSNNTMDRPAIPPTRYDFVAFIPMGMSSHVTDALFYPNTPIWKPRGWFEITETGLMWANQFEIESNNFNTSDSDVRNYRCIINGGYFTQMVRSRRNPCTKLRYYQIGGKAYVKEFYPGNHSQNKHANTLVPVNVTGGEIEQCFMTGYGQGKAYGPNIYFWCAGGRIHKFLGAYMEPPVQSSSNSSSNPGTVDMTAIIDHARIYRFFGGGTSSKARITGHINVTIDHSFIDFYCGGPEFGDMETASNKTVTTTAKNTRFREYYGAGFGGTATTYTNDEDENIDLSTNVNNILGYPSNFFGRHYLDQADTLGRLDYKPGYGIGNCYKFEYIMHSRGHQVVARFYTGYAIFSLAKSGSVTNTLTNCIVERSFYGGGCQGTVDGTVNSTLTGCTIFQNAFGGGYKAESNEVGVYPITPVSPLSSYNCVTSVFSPFGEFPTPETFKWLQGTQEHNNVADLTDPNAPKLYTGTDVTMSDLGNVTGDITIILDGNTIVHGDVFGGGHESKSLSNTLVKILEHTKVFGNIYGGGNMGIIGGNTKVIINGNTLH